MHRGIMLAFAALALNACGAIRNGPQQMVKITTLPPGAAVTVDGQRVSKPRAVMLDRNRNHEVAAELAGFEPVRGEIHRRPDDRVIIGNCLFFLCIPLLWESGEASAFKLVPSELELRLDPEGWSPR